MNHRILIVLLSLALAGCVSSGVSPEKADTVAAIVRPVSKQLVTAVLINNPSKGDALLALAAAADTAALGVELTPATIKVFVDAFAARHHLTEVERIYIASALDDLAKLYLDTYGKQVISTIDPNVVKYLKAFATGIRDGVVFHRAITGAS